MHALDTQRLHLSAFCAAVGVHGNGGGAALAEITSTGKGGGGFFHRGRIRSSQGYHSTVLVSIRRGTGNRCHRFFDARDTTLAAEVNLADFCGYIRERREIQGNRNSDGDEDGFHY